MGVRGRKVEQGTEGVARSFAFRGGVTVATTPSFPERHRKCFSSDAPSAQLELGGGWASVPASLGLRQVEGGALSP